MLKHVPFVISQSEEMCFPFGSQNPIVGLTLRMEFECHRPNLNQIKTNNEESNIKQDNNEKTPDCGCWKEICQ